MEDSKEIEKVRLSWAAAWPRRERLGRLFYARLFDRAPETRALFRQDAEAQADKLTRTLDFVVEHLDEPERMAPEMRALARRHVHYGAEPAHYGVLGEALLWALRETLGSDGFDDPTRDAWAQAYADLCALMLAAAAEDEDR